MQVTVYKISILPIIKHKVSNITISKKLITVAQAQEKLHTKPIQNQSYNGKNSKNNQIPKSQNQKDKTFNQEVLKIQFIDNIKRLNKLNQQNIFNYEKYIKQMQTEKQNVQTKSKKYCEQLKYCIIWMIQIFSLSQNPQKHPQLFQHKLSKQKMRQTFKKLSQTIQQLQIQKKIIQKAQSQLNQSSYLIQQRQSKARYSKIQKYSPNQTSFEQMKDLFDTFQLDFSNKGKKDDMEFCSGQKYRQERLDIVRKKLFVNQDTFGHQIGQHDITQQNIQNYNQDQNQNEEGNQAFVAGNSKISMSKSKCAQNTNVNLSGTVVKIVKQFKNISEDYLQVKKDDQVKLLRKVGDLWIAQMGCKIGYISEEAFNTNI